MRRDTPPDEGLKRYQVGFHLPGVGFVLRGMGDSWEEACRAMVPLRACQDREPKRFMTGP
jgi:hypothetical protein